MIEFMRVFAEKSPLVKMKIVTLWDEELQPMWLMWMDIIHISSPIVSINSDDRKASVHLLIASLLYKLSLPSQHRIPKACDLLLPPKWYYFGCQGCIQYFPWQVAKLIKCTCKSSFKGHGRCSWKSGHPGTCRLDHIAFRQCSQLITFNLVLDINII